MKVLYFHQHFTTPRGAGGTRSYEFARHLVRNGHKVTLVCGTYSGGDSGIQKEFNRGIRRDTVDDIEIIEFKLNYGNAYSYLRRSLIFLRYSFRAIWLALTEDYDVAFATSTPLTVALPGLFAKKIKKKSFVFEVRDLWPELPREMGIITNPLILWAMQKIEISAYCNADQIIGLAPGIVEGIVKRGINKSKITMIPNGCDIELFSQAKVNSRLNDVDEGDLIAVYCGTIGIANNLQFLLDVARHLKILNREEIKLLVIGDGKEKKHLIQRTKKEFLDNIIFQDPLAKEELAKILASCDLGMQLLKNIPAFYYGTSPNKFFDYIASGKAVITNYPGWIANIIVENGIGWVSAPDDSEGFAKLLVTASEDREKIKTMGKRSRQYAVSNFNREKLAEDFENVLHRALQSSY